MVYDNNTGANKHRLGVNDRDFNVNNRNRRPDALPAQIHIIRQPLEGLLSRPQHHRDPRRPIMGEYTTSRDHMGRVWYQVACIVVNHGQ
jgi:hypothetical protein